MVHLNTWQSSEAEWIDLDVGVCNIGLMERFRILILGLQSVDRSIEQICYEKNLMVAIVQISVGLELEPKRYWIDYNKEAPVKGDWPIANKIWSGL